MPTDKNINWINLYHKIQIIDAGFNTSILITNIDLIDVVIIKTNNEIEIMI